jgi:glycosyltransferase involved in cell wall biosynthesis
LNIFFVLPYTPTPVRTRPYNIIKALLNQGHRISLFTVWETNEERSFLNQLADNGINIFSEHLSRPRIGLNIVYALFSGAPLQARYSWHPSLAKQIADNLSDFHNDSDIIHIEHLRGSPYGLHLKQITQKRASSPAIVWDSVDNISSLFEQAIKSSQSSFGRWVTRFELPRTRRYERYVAGQFDQTLVTSLFDKKAFNNLLSQGESTHLPAREIAVLPNGVDFDYFKPARDSRQKDTIVFSGKLSYHANVTTALFLVKQVMPLVWAQRPEIRVQLVGKDPSKALLNLEHEDQRIHVTGTVPDIRPYLCQASLSVVPLVYGAGIQNKVLEAMACETPVVVSTKAISALQATPGQDLLVADTPGDFAGEIVKLLDSDTLRKTIGHNGRQYVVRYHDWNQIVRKIINIYENITHIPERSAA